MALTAHAFITTEGLQARLKRTGSAETDVEQRLIDAVNAATGWLERVTRRRLKARNHRTAVTLTLCSTVGSTSPNLIGNGFTASVEVGDDILNAYVPSGTQVLSITNNLLLVMTRNAVSDSSNLTVTFGSEPITLSGDGTSEIYCPEFPVVELFSAYYKNDDGTRTAIDTDNARIEKATGRIVLTEDYFPAGSMNIDLEVRAGYVQPSTSTLGHPEWLDLEALSYRLGEIFFTDALNIRGRTDSLSVGNLSAQMSLTDMPADVQAGVMRFLRRF